MSCTIQDKALGLDKSPIAGKTVTVAPTAKDPFIKQQDATYKVGEYASFTVTTGADGLWTAAVPWPSETRQGTALHWQVTLPDGAIFAGVVPEGILGPVSLDTLMQSYGWGVVPTTGTPVVIIVGPQGPAGSPGGNAIATPTTLGGVYVDQSPPLGVPTALTALSLGAPTANGISGVASLDTAGRVPLAQIGDVTTAQLSPNAGILGSQLGGTAGIVAAQIASVDGARITGGTVPDAQLSVNIPLLNVRNTWAPLAFSAAVESPAQVWTPGVFTITAGLAVSRTYRFQARQIFANSALTVAKAATLVVSGPPTVGGSATVTRSWAVNIEGGAFAMDTSPPTSSFFGQISLGPGPWDGVTTGRFSGGGAGIGTFLAVNAASQWDGQYLDMQDQGTRRLGFRAVHTQSSGRGRILEMTALVSQTGTAGYDGIYLNVSEPGVGSGGGMLLRLAKFGVDQFTVDNFGSVTMPDQANFIFGTNQGTKIGTSTSQKLGWWGATPVIKGTVSGSRGANAALA